MNKELFCENLNKMMTLLREEKVKKTDFYPICETIDKQIQEDFKNIEEPEDRNLFRYDYNQELSQLEKKMELMKQHPECGLIEATNMCSKKLNEFLKQYNIGFVKDLSLNTSGKLDVTISCLICKMDSFHEKSATKDIEFQLQMDMLEFVGIKTEKTGKGLHSGNQQILASQDNLNAIKKLLLDELGVKSCKITLSDFQDVIEFDTITFKMEPARLFEKEWKMPGVIIKKGEGELDANEVGLIEYNLREMNFSYDNLDSLPETCASLVKSHFAEICRKLDYHGEVYKAEEEKHAKSREMNQKIYNKKQELGTLICKENLEIAVESISKRIEKPIYEKMNYRCQNLEVFSHIVTGTFIFDTGFNFSSYKQMTDEEVKVMYDCNDGNIKDENLFVYSTERNLKIIQKEIENLIPGAVVTNIEICNHWSLNKSYIRSFTLSIDNLNVLF